MIKAEWLLTEDELAQLSNIFPEGFTGRVGLMIANAQAEKILNWGNETCPHDIFGEGTQCFKHACDMCWQTLSGEGE